MKKKKKVIKGYGKQLVEHGYSNKGIVMVINWYCISLLEKQ